MDILTLLTTAKTLGFDVGHIGTLVLIYFLLDRSFSKKFDKLIHAIESLERAHNDRLTTIETKMGLK